MISRVTRNFLIRSEDGTEREVIEVTEFDSYSSNTTTGHRVEREGNKGYETTEGEGVNRGADGSYEVLGELGRFAEVQNED